MAELGYREVRVLAKAKERQNVVGEVGQGQPSLILNAHLDTKPPETRRTGRRRRTPQRSATDASSASARRT
jgi:acetylornithine deacetylase/succinyl-diaminopimelate desuccinylase-like protein